MPEFRSRSTLLPLLLALFLALGLSACGSTSATGDKGYVDPGGTITRLAPADRERPGPVAGQTLSGRPLNLAAYAGGHPVVVNIWADWCAPCRAEAPLLTRSARALSKDGVKFLGIAIRSSPANARAFERRFGSPYPSILDSDGRNLLAFHGTLSPNAIPSTVVLDSRGRVAASILGRVPGQETLEDLVRDVGRS